MKRETGKRIVSKGRYAAQVSKKYGLGIGSLSVVGAGAPLLLVGCFCLFLFLMFAPGKHDPSDVDDFNYPQLLKMGIVGTVGGVACLGTAFFVAKWANKVRVDTPLTRANTASLPVADSLVRASEPPLQAQEAVLLRAAMEPSEPHEAELLHASIGEEKLS